MRHSGPLRFAILLAVTALAAPVLARPADQVRTRVAGLRDLGTAFKAVNDTLRSPQMQPAVVQQSALRIRTAARGMYGWFPAGSGPQPGVKTAARPDIWTRAREFRAAQDAFSREADAFQRVAAGGDASAIRLAARRLGGTCKSCHDTFRTPEN